LTVPARISFVGLGVHDVAASIAFYRSLGWELSDASNEQISFFRTVGGLLMLYGDEALAKDVGASPPRSGAQPFRGVTLAINVESAESVAATLLRLHTSRSGAARPATSRPATATRGRWRTTRSCHSTPRCGRNSPRSGRAFVASRSPTR